MLFDPVLTRHKQIVFDCLRGFKPDLVHITGPGDLGFFGLWASHVLHIPLVASWHTNLHEYLSRRLHRVFNLVPSGIRNKALNAAERHSLRGLLRFYRTARFVLAPNKTQVDLLHSKTGKPAYVIPHGVDLQRYHPVERADRSNRPFCIGYVGRLTTEKNVRALIDLERQLLAANERNFSFLIVGEGGQQKWLKKHLRHAELPGPLKGRELADAYVRMDAFVFPSQTDTFGLVILEAMASGIPVIVTPETGKRVGVEDGVAGFLSDDFAASVQCLMHNPGLRIQMSHAARSFANKSGWDGVFEQLYRTYVTGLSLPDTRRVATPTSDTELAGSSKS